MTINQNKYSVITNYAKARIGFLEVKSNCKEISYLIKKFSYHYHTDICKPFLKVEKLSPNFFEIINQSNYTEYEFRNQKLFD
jgi:hypothetical protein